MWIMGLLRTAAPMLVVATVASLTPEVSDGQVPNDHCGNAVELICGASAIVDTSQATLDASDPPFTCRYGGPAQGVGSVWYKFTPTASSALFSTCASENPVGDTVIAVYSANSSDPCGTLAELGCSDDENCGDGLVSRVCVTGLSTSTEYYVQVSAAYAFGQGEVAVSLTCPCPDPVVGACCLQQQLCIYLTRDDCAVAGGVYQGDGTACNGSCPVPPSNYTCAVAQAIGQLPATVAGTTVGAVNNPVPAPGCVSPPGLARNVWYTVTGTGNVFTATTCAANTPIDTKIVVFKDGCAQLTCVVENDDDDDCGLGAGLSTARWLSEDGAAYWFSVGTPANAFEAGLFELHVSESAPARISFANPPNDNPYVAGQQPFRDVLEPANSSQVPKEIGAPGTPSEGEVSYTPLQVGFAPQPSVAPTAENVVVACTGGAPCPYVVSVLPSGGLYSVTLSGAIPTRGCTTLYFPGTVPGEKLQYQFLPGDTSMNGSVTGQDVLTLVAAINNGTANEPANLARFDINRNGSVTGQDVIRLNQLINGGGYNGATVASCP